jgi:hypothetical protein
MVGVGRFMSASMAGMVSTLGRERGSWLGLCSVGSRETVGRDGASSLGVSKGGGVEGKERGSGRAMASGSSSLSCPIRKQQEEIFAKIY